MDVLPVFSPKKNSLLEGSVEMIKEGVRCEKVGKGGVFGELAILHGFRHPVEVKGISIILSIN